MKIIIFAILAYIFYRIVKGFFQTGKEIGVNRDGGMIDEMVQDPFCKTYIPRREALKRVVGGQEYFFCSDECASKFILEMKNKQ